MINTKNISEELKSHPILRHFPKLLTKWKGKQARLFNLTISHRMIQVKLSDNRYKENISHLLISCMEPISMHGPFDWNNSDLEIEFDGKVFKLYDKVNYLKVKLSDGKKQIINKDIQVLMNNSPLELYVKDNLTACATRRDMVLSSKMPGGNRSCVDHSVPHNLVTIIAYY